MTNDQAALADRRLRAAGDGFELAALRRLRPQPARSGRPRPARRVPGAAVLAARRRPERRAACGCSGRRRTSTRPGRWSIGRGQKAPGGRPTRRPGDGWRCPGCRRTACIGLTSTDLEPGSSLPYRVRRGGEVVFTAEARAPRRPASPIASWSSATAGRARPSRRPSPTRRYRARPDFLLIAGDIVYTRGRISEYREKFWPVYNADVASPRSGRRCCARRSSSPRRATTTRPARDLGKYPDGLAYFYYWDQPLNGPIGPGGRAARPAPAPGPRRTARRSWQPPGRPTRGWRTSRSTTATPTGRSSTPTPTSTGPTPSSGRGSRATWPPPRTPPGGSSPSTIRRSTRRGPTSATSRCGSWPTSSRRARSTSSSPGTSTTTSGRTP